MLHVGREVKHCRPGVLAAPRLGSGPGPFHPLLLSLFLPPPGLSRLQPGPLPPHPRSESPGLPPHPEWPHLPATVSSSSRDTVHSGSAYSSF